MSDGHVYIFGEVLFDHFPDGRRVLGGAPFNVAWHLQAFGLAPRFISRVGTDAEGDEVRAAMRDWGMDQRGLQADSERATGRVSIHFDDGEPVYDIVDNCAYDAIDDAAVSECGLLYHGSLALRHATSHAALVRLLEAQPKTVFLDVNLRPPWWERAPVIELISRANWVKLNRDELNRLGPAAASTREQAEAMLQLHALDGLIVTLGANGAELLTAEGLYLRATPLGGTDIVDTVGAGDALASVMILGLRNAWPLDVTLERAQAFASAIVGRRGATVSEQEFYRAFDEQWHTP
jgi:fructokinase